MLKRALDENCNIICLGDLNINFMANIPTNIRDIIFINGFVNIINKPTHFDNRTGNYSDNMKKPAAILVLPVL